MFYGSIFRKSRPPEPIPLTAARGVTTTFSTLRSLEKNQIDFLGRTPRKVHLPRLNKHVLQNIIEFTKVNESLSNCFLMTNGTSSSSHFS